MFPSYLFESMEWFLSNGSCKIDMLYINSKEHVRKQLFNVLSKSAGKTRIAFQNQFEIWQEK